MTGYLIIFLQTLTCENSQHIICIPHFNNNFSVIHMYAYYSGVYLHILVSLNKKLFSYFPHAYSNTPENTIQRDVKLRTVTGRTKAEVKSDAELKERLPPYQALMVELWGGDGVSVVRTCEKIDRAVISAPRCTTLIISSGFSIMSAYIVKLSSRMILMDVMQAIVFARTTLNDSLPNIDILHLRKQTNIALVFTFNKNYINTCDVAIISILVAEERNELRSYELH